MRRVLIIAYWFPPDQAAGALRPWGLYRHLGDTGFSPLVLTASAGGELAEVIRTPHRRLRDRIPSIAEFGRNAPSAVAAGLRRIRRLISEALSHPDDEADWHRLAVSRGLELLEGGNFEAIVSTSPPATTHVVARCLKARTQVPWIADLRDLWADNYAYPWSDLRRSYDRRVEQRVLADADALVTVSEPLAQTLTSRHSVRVHVVPNGYPPEELAEVTQELTRHFTITYTGTLYPGKQDPSPLFEALARMMAGAAIDPSRLEVRFHGRNANHPWLHSRIEAYGLSRCVSVGGLLTRPEALERQRESQILLALDWMDESQQGVYTSKIFEYLAASRPILSIGRPGSVTDVLLRETAAGVQCMKVEPVKDFLLQAYDEFERTGRVASHGKREAIQDYDHISMARKFARALDDVTHRDSPA